MSEQKSSGKIPFYRSMLPMKGDSPKLVLYKIILPAAGCVFLACIGILINEIFIQPELSDRKQQELKSIYYSDSAGDGPEKSGTQTEKQGQSRLDQFNRLKKINPDIAGWIKIPNTVIDYPVLQAGPSDPEFYLKHDYKKDYSAYGSIFADCTSPVLDPDSRSVILYGHSLNCGSMFTQLSKYKSLEFYKTAPVITFDTSEEHGQWFILSVLVTNTLPEQGQPFHYMKTKFNSDSDFLNFVYQIRIRSIYNTGVSFNAKDKILLLSTCSYEFTGFREVVAARKARPDETGSVSINQAAYNRKVLYPDCWYRKYGGTKPVWPQTYEQAVQDHLIRWNEN